VKQLIEDVARSLGNGARAVPRTQGDHERYYLQLGDGVMIFVHGGGYSLPGRIEFSGHWPTYRDQRGDLQTVFGTNVVTYDERQAGAGRPSITVSDKKTPEQIAKDLERRLFPTLRPLWHRCKAKAIEWEKHGELLADVGAALAKLTNGRLSDDGRNVYFQGGALEYLNIDPSDGRPAHFKLVLNGVNSAQLQVILGLIKNPPVVDLTPLTLGGANAVPTAS
jgi:hypothetical protein